LCQRGAIGLANEGWSFREILGYYFPDSSLVELPAN
jgi:peptidoglycan hydrolase-like amidase